MPAHPATMKFSMLKLVFPLVIAGILSAGQAKTFTGVVRDMSRMASTPAQQCPVIKGPKYTLQTQDGAFILVDENLVARYAGRKVNITGSLTDGNKLHVATISPAEGSR